MELGSMFFLFNLHHLCVFVLFCLLFGFLLMLREGQGFEKKKDTTHALQRESGMEGHLEHNCIHWKLPQHTHSPLSRGTPRIFFKKLWAPKDSMHKFLHGLHPSTPHTISNSKTAATFRTWRLPPFNTTHGCIGDVTYALRDPSTAVHTACNAKEVYRESH